MCGRYAILDEEAILEMREIINQVNQKYAGRGGRIAAGEVRPSNLAPVLRAEDEKVRVDVMKWGFPRWDKSSGLIINGRAETVTQKTLFSASFQSRRVVVPASGFFEWDKREPARRIQYYFSLPGLVVYMAGFYSQFRQKDGTLSDCFVILTMPAASPVAAIHDRMPVILPKNAIRNYLDPAADAVSMLAQLTPPVLRQSLWHPGQPDSLDQNIGLGWPEEQRLDQ